MDYTRYVSLDVNAVSASVVVKAKQGDDSLRYINATLMKDGVAVSPESGSTAQFRLEKPDGKAVVNTAAIQPNGSVTITLTEQATAVAGRCRADILVLKDNKTISTALFILEVVPSPNVADQAVSSDEFKVLEDLISEAEQVVSDSKDKSKSITLSTSWSGDSEPYTQTITISGYTVTSNTRVDLVCDATNINKLIADGVGRIYVTNNNGTLTAYATGSKPTTSITVQAILSEVKQI